MFGLLLKEHQQEFIHRMNKKIDQGEIICQSFVKVEIIDDAESVFRKLVK